MSEPLVPRVLAAVELLEELQANPVTNAAAYTPQHLRNIVRMMTGEGER